MNYDEWVTPSEMNVILGNQPGSSAFRTILGRHPELKGPRYRRSSLPEEKGEWRYHVGNVMQWDSQRLGKGNRTPGWHGVKAEVNV